MSNENPIGMKPLIVFYAGVGAVAVIIGLLTGLSSSPVVGILMPLVFSVLTAGGTVYAHLVKMSEANKTSLLSSTISPQTLGKQLLCFSIAFLLGLWLGVQAKLTPSLLWHSGSARIPAYDSSTIAFQDTRLLAAAMKLDSDMIASGLDHAKREAILRSTSDAIQFRRRQALNIAGEVEATQEHLVALKNGLGELQKLVDGISPPKPSLQHKSKQATISLAELLAKLDKEQNEISLRITKLREAHTNKSSVDLLSPDEIRALEPILLGKAENRDEYFYSTPKFYSPPKFNLSGLIADMTSDPKYRILQFDFLKKEQG